MYFRRKRILLLTIALFVFAVGVVRAEERVIKADKISDTREQKKNIANEETKRSGENIVIANKLFISGAYYTSDRAVLGVGYAIHKYLRVSVNAGFDISNRKEVYDNTKIVETNSYQFYPLIKLDSPVISGKWAQFVLSLYSGPVIYKIEKGEREMGNMSGFSIQSEIFTVRDVSVSISLGSGIEYYSYESPFMGNGLKTNFNVGFNYYF